jgi:Holliday junction resolvase
MGKPSRDKGARFELEIKHTADAHGLTALRVPLSGATNFAKGDVVVSNATDQWTIEAKKRANGFKTIYGWLEKGDCDLLVLGADRKPALAVLPLADFFDLLAGRHT